MASLANRILAGVALGAALGGAWYVSAHGPGSAGSLYPPCLFKLSTGLHCPGCGGTRALHQALNGDVAGAMQQNALAVIALPLGILMLLCLAAYALTGKWFGRVRVPGRAWWIIGAVLVLFAILRNLPGFEWLAPY